MTLTNFPDGISSMGVPFPGAGGSLVPFTGNYYFVDAVSGSDGNTGGAEDPLATIGRGLALATAGNNDVIIIVGDGATTGTQRLSSTLVWNKNATHLIGMTAPTMIAQRARISTATGATTNVNPLVQVTANGCMFANFSTFQGVGQSATDEQLWSEEGQRNYYWNVQFGGMGSDAGAQRAGSYTLRLYGAAECTFDSCAIGLDTRTRTAANASVLLRKNASNVAATRNVFRDCLFPMLSTGGTALFVDANQSGSLDRFVWFKRCVFMNAVNSTGTVVTAVAAFHASQGGTIFFDDCSAVGATDWTATDTGTVKITGAVPNGDTSGMAVNSDAT